MGWGRIVGEEAVREGGRDRGEGGRGSRGDEPKFLYATLSNKQ